MATTFSPSSTSRRLRVLLLTHEDFLPPEKAPPGDSEDAPWKAERDVLAALAAMGHEARAVGLVDDLTVVRDAVAEMRPHLAFNLIEEFDGIGRYDQNVVSYLELIGLPYTGCNPRGLMLARDKALAKKVLAYHGVPSPAFEVFRRGHPARRPKDLGFPLIVKSLTEEASLGISRSSVVHDDAKLAERVHFLHRSIEDDALVESYIDGRELYVGVLGNRRIDVLPVWELALPKTTAASPRIATRRVKWNAAYRKRHGITSGPATDLPAAIAEEAQRIARTAYRALDLNGYARMDMRLSADGKLHFIEANPNPHIGDGEDFAASAGHAGLPYAELVSRIVRLGMRWGSA